MSPETRAELDKLAARIGNLSASPRTRPRVARTELAAIHAGLGQLLAGLEGVESPPFTFDPTDPDVAGRMAALVLTMCPRHPLAGVRRFWGSGVYALYYRGVFDAYGPLAGTEHPIYVGKAGPQAPASRTPMEQGSRLSTRLQEHQKTIARAANLDLADFDYRALVVQSGFESAAESHLIHVFRPVWNKETKICYGIGKHGDAPETRANKRSPWDTLHPGRSWAGRGGPAITDARSVGDILRKIARHFEDNPPVAGAASVLEHLLGRLVQ